MLCPYNYYPIEPYTLLNLEDVRQAIEAFCIGPLHVHAHACIAHQLFTQVLILELQLDSFYKSIFGIIIISIKRFLENGKFSIINYPIFVPRKAKH